MNEPSRPPGGQRRAGPPTGSRLAPLASIEDLDDGFVTVDRDWRFTYVNARAALDLGRPAAEIVGRDMWQLFPDIVGTDQELICRRAMQERVALSIELQHPVHPFTYRMAVFPCADGIAVTLTDTTERRRADEALRDSELFYRQTLESIPGMVFTTRPDGYCDYQSQQWVEYTGIPLSEHLGDGWNRLLHPDDQPRALAAWQAAVAGRAPYDLEYRVRRRDGAYEWFRVVGRPLRGASGEIERWLGVALNIQELREADRRKNDFLAVLSHELRNPLAPILNSVFVLRHAVPGGEQAARAHDVIERQAQQLSRLVEDLLEVTRMTQGKIRIERETVELGTLVRRSAGDYRHKFADAGVQLRVSTPDAPVFVDADPARLAQVIGNLLSNAAKFTDRGGRTDVALETEGESAVVRVRDTGVGIATEFLPRVFEPFAQAEGTLDRTRGGLGLGLPVLKGLVELHGGSVTAHSAGPDRGAEFAVRLPLSHRAPDVEASPPAAPVSARRVLVVEDNADAADSLRQVLELHGHTVEVARTGMEGIERARRMRPDVVLCDIGLPGMSGFEVARALRADPELSCARLVALSGYALPEDVAATRAAGFDRHIAKPVDPAELADL